MGTAITRKDFLVPFPDPASTINCRAIEPVPGFAAATTDKVVDFDRRDLLLAAMRRTTQCCSPIQNAIPTEDGIRKTLFANMATATLAVFWAGAIMIRTSALAS